jgi:hypothetical protein
MNQLDRIIEVRVNLAPFHLMKTGRCFRVSTADGKAIP